MISEIREAAINELAKRELIEAELNGVAGGTASQHTRSNCMRAPSDTQNTVVSDLRV